MRGAASASEPFKASVPQGPSNVAVIILHELPVPALTHIPQYLLDVSKYKIVEIFTNLLLNENLLQHVFLKLILKIRGGTCTVGKTTLIKTC